VSYYADSKFVLLICTKYRVFKIADDSRFTRTTTLDTKQENIAFSQYVDTIFMAADCDVQRKSEIQAYLLLDLTSQVQLNSTGEHAIGYI